MISKKCEVYEIKPRTTISAITVALSLRWLRRNAQRSEQSAQNGEGFP